MPVNQKLSVHEQVAVLVGLADALETSADRIGILDAAELYTANDVEAALAEVMTAATTSTSAAALEALLASTDAGEGAALVGIEDAGNLYTAATVEAALAEVKALADAAAVAATLAATTNGDGASLIGVENTGGVFTATTVQGILVELEGRIAVVEGGT